MIAERTKTVTLTFYREQLLYDCKNYAFVVGDTMKTDDEHDRHQVMDIGEDGNVDRVTRILDLGIARCAEVLYPYSKVAVGDTTSMDDELEETTAYVIELLVPDDFSQTTVNYLERLIHELLVAFVMADWLSIAYPGKAGADAAAVWENKKGELEEQIKSSMNARVGRVRKTQTPF